MLRLPLLLAALLSLPSCDSGGGAVGITGTWEGEVYAAAPGATRYPVTLRLSDTGATVTGEGTVEIAGADPFEFVVYSGSFVGRTVTLDTRFDMPPFNGGIDGTLTGTSPGMITGTFQGRGVVGDSRIEVELVDR